MAIAGKSLDNLDVISHILLGLDEEYDGFVATITALIKAEKNVSLSDVYSQFMSYEARMESRKSSDGLSVNSATRGCHGGGVDVETIRIITVIVGMSMISAVVMAMAIMIVRITVVAVAAMAVAVVAMVVVVAMVARIMAAAPMKPVRYVARLDTLH
jgi:hypothetical protein